jgi:hypothetical protein
MFPECTEEVPLIESNCSNPIIIPSNGEYHPIGGDKSEATTLTWWIVAENEIVNSSERFEKCERTSFWIFNIWGAGKPGWQGGTQSNPATTASRS